MAAAAAAAAAAPAAGGGGPGGGRRPRRPTGGGGPGGRGQGPGEEVVVPVAVACSIAGPALFSGPAPSSFHGGLRMKLICGLGNPGREYERHRHNIGLHGGGARCCARARAALDPGASSRRAWARAPWAASACSSCEPQTFMNLSGRSVAAAARFYKVAPEDVLVIHDELDLPFGRLQLKAGGGAGGHNGLKSIVEQPGRRTASSGCASASASRRGPTPRSGWRATCSSNFDDERAPAAGGRCIDRAARHGGGAGSREGLASGHEPLQPQGLSAADSGRLDGRPVQGPLRPGLGGMFFQSLPCLARDEARR